MGAPSTHASTFLDLAARLRGLAASPRCGLRGWWMLGRRSESASLTFFGARSHDFRGISKCDGAYVDGVRQACEHQLRKKGGDVEWAMPVGIQRPRPAHFSLSECIQLR